jgi:DNA-binding NarL/FixJ family response regulator
MTTTSKAPASMKKYSVLIVDDHPIVRQGLEQLIAQEPDISVCGGASNVHEALCQIAQLQPDLVLVDISLKESNGLDLLPRMKAACGHAKALVWSMFDEAVYAERALRGGASGYVNKQESVETVIDAVRHVLRGNIYLSPRMTDCLERREEHAGSVPESPVSLLSNREMEVFTLIGHGMNAHEIAGRWKVSTKTVETHRERIKVKLRLRGAAEVSRRALLWVLENG